MNRGLTLEQALAGVQPPTLTKAEWQAMHDASLLEAERATQHTADATFVARSRRPHGARA